MTGPSGADEFAAQVSGVAAEELVRLLDLPGLPVARDRTWHAVASVLLATADGQVLLARSRYGWGTVGGHVEPSDASLREAAVREAREELGILLLPGHLEPLSLVVDQREVVPGCAHWDFCFVLPVAAEVDVTAQSDVTEVAWFPLGALPEVNHHMRQHLDALRARLEDGQGGHRMPRARVAARGIVRRGDRLLLLLSGTHGDVKFPGGGVEHGETLEQALARELLEECGRTMTSVGPVALTVVESHPDAFGDGLFTMVSHYLTCAVDEAQSVPELEAYEAELDLHPVWLTLDEAIASGESALARGTSGPWAPRELAALRQLPGVAGGSASDDAAG